MITPADVGRNGPNVGSLSSPSIFLPVVVPITVVVMIAVAIFSISVSVVIPTAIIGPKTAFRARCEKEHAHEKKQAQEVSLHVPSFRFLGNLNTIDDDNRLQGLRRA
jgi:hypothetical protein